MSRHVQNTTVTVGTSSTQILPARTAGIRVGYYLTNTNVTAVLTIAKGAVQAVANSGVVLQPANSMVESSGDRLLCWQGAIQGISTLAGATVGISEEWFD